MSSASGVHFTPGVYEQVLGGRLQLGLVQDKMIFYNKIQGTHQGGVQLREGIVDHALPSHGGGQVGDDSHGLLQLGTTGLCNIQTIVLLVPG